MSRSTGPILVAGALTWANQTVLADGVDTSQAMQTTARIGVATGMLAAMFFGLEKLSPAIALPLAYTALVTTLLVPIDGKPTPLERALKLVT